jgi:hypothetical protein
MAHQPEASIVKPHLTIISGELFTREVSGMENDQLSESIVADDLAVTTVP